MGSFLIAFLFNRKRVTDTDVHHQRCKSDSRIQGLMGFYSVCVPVEVTEFIIFKSGCYGRPKSNTRGNEQPT